MAELAAEPDGGGATPLRSLRLQLLLSLNGSMLVVLALFLCWDGRVHWRQLLDQKRVVMREEAKTLLPGVFRLRDDLEATQDYIDDVCSLMSEKSSPGHHIAVQVGNVVLHAQDNSQETGHMLAVMRGATDENSGFGNANGQDVVVGRATRGDVSIFVSERMSTVRRAIWADLLRRSLGVLCLGLMLGVLLNLLLTRLVITPLGAVVEAVRQIESGALGAQVPPMRTRELAFLAAEFNAMSQALEEAESRRHRQMEKARRIQENLIPSGRTEFDAYVVHVYQPAEHVAGDYFDVQQMPDRSVLLCVADVTGHGVPAAMGASMLKTLFASAVERSCDPAHILTNINTAFCPVSLDEDFASMIVVNVNSAKRKAVYASAGHEHGYLLCKDGGIELLESTGPLLGIDHGLEWETRELAIGRGDRIVLVTDGIIEARLKDDELFGRERLVRVLEDMRTSALKELPKAVLREIGTNEDSEAPIDDITLLAMEV